MHPATHEPGVAVPPCDLGALELKAERSEIQGHPQLTGQPGLLLLGILPTATFLPFLLPFSFLFEK